MKTNIQALMNMIAENEKKLTHNSYIVKDLAISTSVQELNGTINIIEDNKDDFKKNLLELEKVVSELSRLKSILYEKNNSFKLSDGRTIQQAIVDNTNLRKLKCVYEQLVNFKNVKRRVTEVNNSYFECQTINYDTEEIKNKIIELNSIIQKTDFEISKLNSVEFEI